MTITCRSRVGRHRTVVLDVTVRSRLMVVCPFFARFPEFRGAQAVWAVPTGEAGGGHAKG